MLKERLGEGELSYGQKKDLVKTTKLRTGLYEGSIGIWDHKRSGETDECKTLSKRLINVVHP